MVAKDSGSGNLSPRLVRVNELEPLTFREHNRMRHHRLKSHLQDEQGTPSASASTAAITRHMQVTSPISHPRSLELISPAMKTKTNSRLRPSLHTTPNDPARTSRQLQYGGWNPLGNSIVGEVEQEQFGRSVSMNADGTIIAAGSYGYGHCRVRVFQFTSGVWNQLGNSITGEAEGDRFGYSVALSASGMILAVGAPWNTGSGTKAGHTRVFQFDGTSTWIQLGGDIDAEGDNGQAGW